MNDTTIPEPGPEAGPGPQEAAIPSTQADQAPGTLRWWPAAALLILTVLLKNLTTILEAPPFPVVMAAFMGPAVVSVVILLWWLFGSRASLREKLTGAILIGITGVVSVLLLHQSMQGMTSIIYQVPTGVGLFALTLIVFAARPSRRLPAAIIASAAGFGIWDLLQLEGVTGKFSPEFLWRWSPTSEQQYLESRAVRTSDGVTVSKGEQIPEDAAEEISRNTAQWSDFRGPRRDGRLPGITLEEDWNTHPPRMVWKSRVGPGWSSFSVSGIRLFTQEQRGDNEAVVCLNSQDGRELWSWEYPGRFWESVAGAGPRATPTIGDDALYCLGANGILLRLDPASGDLVWQRDLQEDSGRKPPQWGFSSSPLVHAGLVIVHAGGPGDKGVLAYDGESGESRWSVASGDHSYSSPQLAEFDGVTGILMQTNDGLQFLNTQDGAVLWNHDWKVTNYRAIQPLVSGNSVLLATSLGLGTRRITVNHSADKWETKEEWTSKDIKPDFNDFVEHREHVYGFDGNIFACVSLSDGKRAWKRGRYGNGQVLLLSDSGQLLIISESGELVLVRADPKQLIEVGKIPAIQGKTWNHPVLIGNRVYLRNGEEVACYELQVHNSSKTESASKTGNGSETFQ